MLQRLHVKNLALIEETEVEFAPGLNILTGETGAGKSMLIDSVNLALGAKFERDMLRSGAESALVELVFDSSQESVRQKLKEMDLESGDGEVIISRKMQPGKSVCKINGESVPSRQVKELAEVLLDIHGQHEHQSLLHKKKHLEILDVFCREEGQRSAGEVSEYYKEVQKLKKQLEEESMDDAAKTREQSLAEFECREIEEADLKPGEDEELEQLYRRMSNSLKINESLAESYRYSGTEGESGAATAVGRALKALQGVSAYDERLGVLENQLAEIDSLLADYNRDMAQYRMDSEFDGEAFAACEERLNTVNRLKGKYGNTIEEILDYAQACREKLEKLADYDAYMEELRRRLQDAQSHLEAACGELSDIRKKNAEILTGQLTQALLSLNFAAVQFEIAVRPAKQITESGCDDVEFLISTNPGEALKPLNQVASGGELSRVMLAIKTVLAESDEIDTLIFDEIDAGISGRTAWKVAGQLGQLGKAHQVLCITHLPQIAAMADTHFVIEKNAADNRTVTDIRKADQTKELAELARLLGSDEVSEAALQNAAELKKQAMEQKAE